MIEDVVIRGFFIALLSNLATVVGYSIAEILINFIFEKLAIHFSYIRSFNKHDLPVKEIIDKHSWVRFQNTHRHRNISFHFETGIGRHHDPRLMHGQIPCFNEQEALVCEHPNKSTEYGDATKTF